MNVLVTVGTTSFDPLVEAIDTGPFADKALLQIADGDYQPRSARWFKFDKNIQKHIDNADVVVCHAGAGSIYNLLERGIVPLVVPNTIRRDQHQLEIARWLAKKQYAVVAMNVSEVNRKLADYQNDKLNCNAFNEQRFFYQDKLIELVRSAIEIRH